MSGVERRVSRVETVKVAQESWRGDSATYPLECDLTRSGRVRVGSGLDGGRVEVPPPYVGGYKEGLRASGY